MKKILLILSAVATTFVACSDNNANDTATATSTDSNQISLNDLNASPATVSTDTNKGAQTVEIKMDQNNAGQPAAAVANTAKPAGKVNPPHGEPGHDCALPVGAPLDGSAAPAAAKPTIAPMPAATPAATAAPASGTGKINPPHGEPGHDCAKPVGAPL